MECGTSGFCCENAEMKETARVEDARRAKRPVRRISESLRREYFVAEIIFLARPVEKRKCSSARQEKE
jgi:hypothetical protein